jgi:hypothetical protein
LSKISLKLKLVTDDLLKRGDGSTTDECLVLFDKLTQSIINLVHGNPPLQDKLRDNIPVFPVTISYLQKILEGLNTF